ncbi:hypothetical protein BCEN4_420002 [Burkholderia cenocepacia]|uniref:hypothetical protein n=1 Tax=Burkholderia cenocepacia TaxID=95486 RepID=UPI00192AF0B4|nr:hypothetical protein [Burkholderia cenocepacia]CAD9224552.1 hypothetical protein BCEN4_420002 [Burkholderia cenocepacia]
MPQCVHCFAAHVTPIDPHDALQDIDHLEADRLIERLTSADPNFDEYTETGRVANLTVSKHRGACQSSDIEIQRWRRAPHDRNNL